MASRRGFLLLLLASMVMAMDIPAMQCDRDIDCKSDDGAYYCQFSMCERCIPCEQVLYRRSPLSASGQTGCARTEDDCGACLPGYQSEDLTGQRHSIKCYPIPSDVKGGFESPVDSSTRAANIGVTMMSIIVVIIVALLVIAGGCFVLFKHRQSSRTEASGPSRREEARKLVDRLPPPYELPEETEGEICGLVRASENIYTVVAVQPDHLNQATPINPYHHTHQAKLDSDLEEEDINEVLHAVQESQPTNEDGNGSTETIPSQWEPSSTIDLHMESPPAVSSAPFQPLTRSQSLELLSLRPVSAVLTSSTSDPALSDGASRRRSSEGESYSHRHVRLSMHRLPITPILPAPESMCVDPNVPSCSRSSVPFEEECEPTEPQSFVFEDSQLSTNDVSYESNFLTSSLLSFTGSLYGRPISSSTPTTNETGRGSRDSGFFDQSRRRPATDELSFEFAVFFKRSREE